MPKDNATPTDSPVESQKAPEVIQTPATSAKSMGQFLKDAYEAVFAHVKGVNPDTLKVSVKEESQDQVTLTVSGKPSAVELILDELRTKAPDAILSLPQGLQIPATNVKYDESNQSADSKKIIISHFVTQY